MTLDIKKHNALTVFQAIRDNKGLSMQEICQATGLSWGSVYSICHSFLDKGLLVECEKNVTVGRPPKILKVNSTRKLSLGIDINSVGLSFHIINLGGDSVYSDFLPLFHQDKTAVLDVLTSKTQDIIALYPDLIGINLSMQGKINRESGVSIRTNFFRDWNNVPLTDYFVERFGIPTALYHDPECLLSFHMHTDDRIKQSVDGICVRVDEGIGYAQCIGGKLYETSQPDATCEFGHTIVVPDGETCICGRKGCLEAYASLRGMKMRYTERTGIVIDDFLSVQHTPEGQAIIKDAARYLGIALSNLFSLHCPSFVMLDGILFSKLPSFYEAVRRETRAYARGQCNLLRAMYHRDAAAIGASIMTIDKKLVNIVFEN